MRAVAILAFLELLEQRTGQLVAEMFDLIVGTSTGGVVAVALGLLRWRAAQVRELYLQLGKEVFAPEAKGSLVSQGHYYPPAPLEAVFRRLLGERLFADFPPADGVTPHVCVVANEIDQLPALKVAFRNWGADEPTAMCRIPVWVALRATTAAPLYFPCVTWSKHSYIDGGMGANNPCVDAVRMAELLWGLHALSVVVSVGTGQFPRRKNTYLSLESAGRSFLGGNTTSTGVFSRLVSTAVSAGSTLGLIQMLGELAVAVDGSQRRALWFSSAHTIHDQRRTRRPLCCSVTCRTCSTHAGTPRSTASSWTAPTRSCCAIWRRP